MNLVKSSSLPNLVTPAVFQQTSPVGASVCAVENIPPPPSRPAPLPPCLTEHLHIFISENFTKPFIEEWADSGIGTFKEVYSYHREFWKFCRGARTERTIIYLLKKITVSEAEKTEFEYLREDLEKSVIRSPENFAKIKKLFTEPQWFQEYLRICRARLRAAG